MALMILRFFERCGCVWLLFCMLVAISESAAALHGADTPTRILILVGPSSHPPGTHEVGAGARLVEYCLEHAENVPGIQAEVITAWPKDPASLDGVASVVFSGDRFPPAEMPDGQRIMTDLSKMMDRGCGILCFHYATGLGANHVPANGDHPLLRWMGGYFATRCPHHQSVARVFQSAKIEPTPGEHPVLRGWQAFEVHDEPYIKNYFGPNGIGKNVTPLATSLLPPESPQREIVAWAVSREDGGRGVGVVMPHFYRNWQIEDLRRLILNGVVWTAKRDVPVEGVRTKLPALTSFEPGAVEPQPRPTKK